MYTKSKTNSNEKGDIYLNLYQNGTIYKNISY